MEAFFERCGTIGAYLVLALIGLCIIGACCGSDETPEQPPDSPVE